MTRHRMSEADWLAVARVFHAIHQRRAAAGAAGVPAVDERKAAVRELAVQNARARRGAAAGDGDDDG